MDDNIWEYPFGDLDDDDDDMFDRSTQSEYKVNLRKNCDHNSQCDKEHNVI